MDETYIKIKGKNCYLYRAVDKTGKTIDFIVTEKRDKEAALSFFLKAIGSCGLPEKITVDKSGANKAALDRLTLYLFLYNITTCNFFGIEIRQIKYLNNVVEQDLRRIKRITKPMMGFKYLQGAHSTIAGIKLHRMLKKGQHKNAANESIFEQFYGLAG